MNDQRSSAHPAPDSALTFAFEAIPDLTKRVLLERPGMRLFNTDHNRYDVIGKN